MPSKLRRVLFVVTLVAVLTLAQVVQAQRGGPPGRMGGMMGHGADAQTIHQLFAAHGHIERIVEEIPGGIRAVTESDDPAVAALIQTHVSRMYAHVVAKQAVPMMGMSPTLSTMISSADHYQRSLHVTPNGIEVTETSDNPELVATIREHAQEVTHFVEQGMPAMMRGGMGPR